MEPNDAIVLTGSASMVARLTEAFEPTGKPVLPFPTLALHTRFTEEIRETLNKLGRYQWLVFTSRQGVLSFFEGMEHAGLETLPTHLATAVIGEKTAGALREKGITPEFVSEGIGSVDFAENWVPKLQDGDHVLLAVSSLAADTLEYALPDAVKIHRLEVYDNVVPPAPDQATCDQLRAGQYRWVVVTSPSAIRNFEQMTGVRPDGKQVISIGPSTTKALRQLGLTPAAEATEPSVEGLLVCWKQLNMQKH